MKIFTKIPVLAVALALASLPFVEAADNTGTAPATNTATPALAGRHPRLRAMVQRRMVAARRAARRLELGNDQVAQLKSLRAQTRSAIRGIRTDSSLTPVQKRAKMRETLQGARAGSRNALTPEQRAQLQQLRAQRRALRAGAP